MPATPRVHRAPRAAASLGHLVVVPARRASLVVAPEHRGLRGAAPVAVAARQRR